MKFEQTEEQLTHKVTCLNKRNAVQDQVDIKNLIVIDLTVTPAQVPCQVTVKDTMKRFSTIPLVGCYCPMS